MRVSQEIERSENKYNEYKHMSYEYEGLQRYTSSAGSRFRCIVLLLDH